MTINGDAVMKNRFNALLPLLPSFQTLTKRGLEVSKFSVLLILPKLLPKYGSKRIGRATELSVEKIGGCSGSFSSRPLVRVAERISQISAPTIKEVTAIWLNI